MICEPGTLAHPAEVAQGSGPELSSACSNIMLHESDTLARPAVVAQRPEPELPPTAPRLLPTLDQLPYHVLYRLAECMSQPWLPARVDMLHLALAAPTLYEPCIAAAIRTGTGMNSPNYRLRLVYPDRVDLTEHEIGHLVSVTNVATDRLQYYLILPPRNHQGALLPWAQDKGRFGRTKPSRCSRKWSLLPVPLHQRLTFDMIGKNPSLALPPHCKYMYLYHAAPWRDPQFHFPKSLAMLHLRNTVPEGVDASQVLSTLPRHLMRLTLSYSKPDQFAMVLPQLLPHIPPTLTTMTVDGQKATREDMHWIAQLVGSMPNLTTFSISLLRCCEKFENVLAALPRTGLKKLSVYAFDSGFALGYETDSDIDDDDVATDHDVDASENGLGVGVEDEIGPAEHANGTASATAAPVFARRRSSARPTTLRYPTTVEFFELRLLSADMRRIGLVGRDFPAVTRELSIDVSDWGPNMIRTLPLASTLRRLKVHFSENANVDSIAAALLPRLPASLQRIDFSDSPLGGTVFVPALAQHLPPQLSDLLLADCGISISDVAQLAGRWPPTLRRLDLSSRCLSRTNEVMNLLPTGLRELRV
ncbi:hypothetical protein GGF31_006091 [Allomyces arbusculus]|nr:hypothetical protein GGF31_006091 [Allomyces arbusculus]